MAIRFNEQDVRDGSDGAGVKGIKLKKDYEVVDMVVVRQGASLLTVCEHGFGKRTDLEDYREQRRGTGTDYIKTTERNGKVVARGGEFG